MDPFPQFILRLAVVIATILYHQDMTLKAITDAKLLVLPLWNTSGSDSDFCHVDESNAGDGLISLQGDPYHSCSLQIDAPPDSLTSIRLLEDNNGAENIIYIERKGSPGKCTNKYVAIEGQNQGCSALFAHKQLELNMFGNVSVLIREMHIAEALFNCPESDLSPQTEIESNQMCYAKGYEKMISCATKKENEEQNEGVCHVNFMSNCIVFLFEIEVVFQCMNKSLAQNETRLLLYPPGISEMYLNESNIVQIDDNAFQHLPDLQTLDLSGNQLEYIPRYVFRGLTHLNYLDLGRNKLHTLPLGIFDDLEEIIYLYLYENRLMVLDEDMFQGVAKVEYISLKNNFLFELPSNFFQGLTHLTHLYLSGNRLNVLPAGIFHGLRNIKTLYLDNNQLISINETLFHDMKKCTTLKLWNNNLNEIPPKSFQGLSHLRELDLYGNNLTFLNPDIFKGLTNLIKLVLGGNMLTVLPRNLFQDLQNLEILYITDNRLRDLPHNLFKGLGNITKLSLRNNSIQLLHADIFSGLSSLTELSLDENRLKTLGAKLLQNLGNLNRFFAQSNQIDALEAELFKDALNLVHIDFYGNQLTSLPRRLFAKAKGLRHIYFVNNKLRNLDFELFQGLSNLTNIVFWSNEIQELDRRLFNGLINLERITFTENKLRKLDPLLFKGLKSLKDVFLGYNQLSELDEAIFRDTQAIEYINLDGNGLVKLFNLKKLINLIFLDIELNPLTDVNDKSFEGISRNAEVIVSQHEICKCYTPDYIKCSASDGRSPYLTCRRLLSDRILVIIMWLIGINALGGNIFVLAWRKKSPQKNKIQDFLLSNLALSDLLMGVYMLIIASADIYFGQKFPMQSESWRSGITCRSAGALSIISSEASVFFVTLISIDRFICIRFPFSTLKLNGRSVTVTATITWVVSFAVGVIPSILSGKNFKFYDNSHVCIGLPLALIERFHQDVIRNLIFYEGGQINRNTYNTTSLGFQRGLYFSSSLFLGLNCLCYFVIFACYVEIVRAVFKSARKAKLNKEMKDQVQMTAKVAAIVATDFCCWFPIILMGILVQTRVVTLPPTVYDWSVTFVLPINSAINPYLYTVSAIIGDKKKQNTSKVPAGRALSFAAGSQQQQNLSSVTEDTHL